MGYILSANEPSSILSIDGLGKDVPTMGPWKNFNPRLQSGRGRGQAIINAGILAYRFAVKYRRPITGIGAVGAGALVGRRNGKTNGKFYQAHSPVYRPKRSKLRNIKSSPRRCCCCTKR